MFPPSSGLSAALCLFAIAVRVVSETSNIGTLRSLNATVSGSSEHSDNFALSHAVDGSNGTDGDKCNCCAATIEQFNPWMRVDLGRLYRIDTVEVFGRTDKYQDLKDMHMFIHIQPDKWIEQHSGNWTIPDIGDRRNYTFPIADPVIGQYVTLQLTYMQRKILVVCEIEIYSQGCRAGLYGPHCDDTCGHCQDDETCDDVTGSCPRCAAGYKGNTCKTACSDETFGQGCSDRCHCFNNEPCDPRTGSCPDDRCDLGWQGGNCSSGCGQSHYGENCREVCGHCYGDEACNVKTGVCRSCSSGYKGDKCTTVSQTVESIPCPSPSPVIWKALVGIFVPLVVCGLGVIIWHRRRRRRRDTTYEEPTLDVRKTLDRTYGEVDGKYMKHEPYTDSLETEDHVYTEMDIFINREQTLNVRETLDW